MSDIKNMIKLACSKYLLIGGMHVCAYYYMLTECEYDIGYEEIDIVSENSRAIVELINEVFSGNKDIEYLTERTSAIRKDTRECMSNIVAYIDKARLLEYVLLRIKPSDGETPKEVNDDAVARDLLTAIFKGDNNAVINENIRKAVSKLPVRMTKEKYFDILKNELKAYIGQPRTTLNRVMYLMRSGADLGDYPKVTIPEFEDDYLKLSEYAHAGITDDDKEFACAEIEELIDFMGDFRDAVELQMKVIDYLLVYLLNYEDAASDHIDTVMDMDFLIKAADDVLRFGSPEKMPPSLTAGFDKIAERAETEYEDLEKLLAKIGKIEENIEDEAGYLERFIICDRLLSGYAFAELTVENDEDIQNVTEQILDETLGDFIKDFNKAAAGSSKALTRARMASTFTCIPPFFNNRTEVMNYVLDSLKGCRDIYEKTAAIEEAEYAIS